MLSALKVLDTSTRSEIHPSQAIHLTDYLFLPFTYFFLSFQLLLTSHPGNPLFLCHLPFIFIAIYLYLIQFNFLPHSFLSIYIVGTFINTERCSIPLPTQRKIANPPHFVSPWSPLSLFPVSAAKPLFVPIPLSRFWTCIFILQSLGSKGLFHHLQGVSLSSNVDQVFFFNLTFSCWVLSLSLSKSSHRMAGTRPIINRHTPIEPTRRVIFFSAYFLRFPSPSPPPPSCTFLCWACVPVAACCWFTQGDDPPRLSFPCTRTARPPPHPSPPLPPILPADIKFVLVAQHNFCGRRCLQWRWHAQITSAICKAATLTRYSENFQLFKNFWQFSCLADWLSEHFEPIRMPASFANGPR